MPKPEFDPEQWAVEKPKKERLAARYPDAVAFTVHVAKLVIEGKSTRSFAEIHRAAAEHYGLTIGRDVYRKHFMAEYPEEYAKAFGR